MSLKLKDEFVEADLKLGPMPDFHGSFERFFIEKAANLIFGSKSSSSSPTCSTSSYENDEEYISIEESNDLHWMHSINLASNRSEQNLEIIYNDKNVYFKTLRCIYKNEDLLAFPSKDLEISLGLQFIPIKSDDNYQCRKCLKMFKYQYHLMLHSRYFCSLTANNLMKASAEDDRISADLHSFKKEKRKLADAIETSFKKVKQNDLNYSSESTLQTNLLQFNQANKLNEKYYENLLANFMPHEKLKDANTNINLIKSIFERLNAYTHHLNQLSNDYNMKNFINPNLISNNYNQLQAVLNNNNIINTANTSVSSNNKITQDQTINKLNETKLNNNNTSNSLKKSVNQAKTMKPANAFEINQMINTQTLQNWCAKCNTHFRLTTDLVFHMRSFHRTNKKDDSLKPELADLASNKLLNRNNTVDKNDSSFKSKYLKCEICHEIFKEKHHLSRHMTSHR